MYPGTELALHFVTAVHLPVPFFSGQLRGRSYAIAFLTSPLKRYSGLFHVEGFSAHHYGGKKSKNEQAWGTNTAS